MLCLANMTSMLTGFLKSSSPIRAPVVSLKIDFHALHLSFHQRVTAFDPPLDTVVVISSIAYRSGSEYLPWVPAKGPQTRVCDTPALSSHVSQTGDLSLDSILRDLPVPTNEAAQHFQRAGENPCCVMDEHTEQASTTVCTQPPEDDMLRNVAHRRARTSRVLHLLQNLTAQLQSLLHLIEFPISSTLRERNRDKFQPSCRIEVGAVEHACHHDGRGLDSF